MDAKRAFPRRIATILLVMLTWLIVWNAAFSFATGQTLSGILGAIAGLILLVAMINGRLVGYLEDRPVPFLVFPLLILIILIYGVGEIQDLLLNDLFLLGEFYLPGFIALIRIIGSLALVAFLVWEVVKLGGQELIP